jgi:hypothetical protein
MYLLACQPSILSAIHRPTVTAGLRWPPEMLMVIETSTANPTPCARATPSAAVGLGPSPVAAKAATLPAPTNTNSRVPVNSAVSGRRSLNMASIPREWWAGPI